MRVTQQRMLKCYPDENPTNYYLRHWLHSENKLGRYCRHFMAQYFHSSSPLRFYLFRFSLTILMCSIVQPQSSLHSSNKNCRAPVRINDLKLNHL
ncbi:hypothetical protein PILCRDRAFT_824368 [Piloderma croceum F 1598]|uniref:Uncharacterized protein n=1 Tax=Piloderma croceum (strain F 1598) TaxID=765440 RepID=A0A0C3F0Z7_PILCF|nr:hypothetical protein PILCRDRAFT_824368 [Piloderma croceum F 1598]